MAQPTLWERIKAFVSGSAPSPEPAVLPPRDATPRKSHGGTLTLARDDTWHESTKKRLDPRLRVALSVLRQGDPRRVFEHTGIRVAQGPEGQRKSVYLPLHLELAKTLTREALEGLHGLGLVVPKAYLAETERSKSLRYVTARMQVKYRGLGIDVATFQDQLTAAMRSELIARISLPVPMVRCEAPLRGETLDDLGLPADRKVTLRGTDFKADGKGVILGIVDDGCCFADWNFLRSGPTSRIAFIWDQSRTRHGAWTELSDFDYGCELDNVPAAGPPPLDQALQNNTTAGVIHEDAVYAAIGFPPYSKIDGRDFNMSTHGTHVMDIAAGSGRSLFGREGVAPEAEIIFVQLPPELVAAGGAVLSRCIQDGVHYIFDRAKKLEGMRGHPVPAVVNVSYGNYVGPHDGSSALEESFDTLLDVDDRAIVVSAGNGFASRCHAQGVVSKARGARLHWEVPPFDESGNRVEIWYTGPGDVEFYLTAPGSSTALGPVTVGDSYNILDGGTIMGYVDHLLAGNGDHVIALELHPTWDARSAPTAAPGLAWSGTWVIELKKSAVSKAANFHAWIERDQPRRADQVRRVQSRFADGESNPRFTVTGMSTGKRTIAVGAYNTATGELAEYSGCGPARPSAKYPKRRQKPELCAPAASDARGRGVLSAATRSAEPRRLGGTSASAPHVAGLVALALQLNRDVNAAQNKVFPLSVAKLRTLLQLGAMAGAQGLKLRPNRHQLADPHQPIKQSRFLVWKYLKGAGKAHAGESLKRVP